MKKLLIPFLLLLLLAACGGASETELSDNMDSQPTTVAAQPTATESAAAAPEATEAPAETTVAETAPDLSGAYPIAATVAEAAAVRPTDHILGAEAPLVTVIEYGDFQ